MKFTASLLVILFIFAKELPAQNLEKIAGKDSAYIILDKISGEALDAFNEDKLLIPASLMKLVTTYGALKGLGPEYRFSTKYYLEEKNAKKFLVIVGSGAPDFTTEEALIAIRALKRRGLKSLTGVKIVGESTSTLYGFKRAFFAMPSPLAINFNSLGIEVCPGKGKSPAIGIEPSEIKLRVKNKASTLKGASIKLTFAARDDEIVVGGSIGRDAKCEWHYLSVSNPSKYFGEVVVSLLKDNGISVSEGFEIIPTFNTDEKPLYEHYSKTLSRLIIDMNRFSSNFYAEALVLALGSLAKLENTISRFGVGKVYDGSGLSAKNRLTVTTLANILHRGVTDESFGVEYLNSLAVPGRIGTLKRRSFALPDGALRAKTGTLNGVSGLAGVLRGKKREVIFAIIQNGGEKDKHERERRFVEECYATY
jgi:D-alanyl-D-alanine carboxypeptidase/D-alanyl-D-alanine-endopeptidase (penicillin-binding protein 4)